MSELGGYHSGWCGWGEGRAVLGVWLEELSLVSLVMRCNKRWTWQWYSPWLGGKQDSKKLCIQSCGSGGGCLLLLLFTWFQLW